jgi:hypothetical protein
MNNKYLYDGLDQEDINKLQQTQKQSVERLREMMQLMQQNDCYGTIMVDFNGSGDSGFFEICEDTSIEDFEEFFEENGYQMDHGPLNEQHQDGASKYIFDWIDGLVTSCCPGFEINEGSVGYVALNFEPDTKPTITVNLNKFNDTDEEIDENGTEYDWEF